MKTLSLPNCNNETEALINDHLRPITHTLYFKPHSVTISIVYYCYLWITDICTLQHIPNSITLISIF